MASSIIRYAGTTQYIGVSITAPVALSSDAVYISINGGVTWTAAAWVGAATQGNGTWTQTAQLLIGPVTTPPLPNPGNYDVRVKVTDNPEQPVLDAGTLVVAS